MLQIICEAYFSEKWQNEQIAHFDIICNDSEIGFILDSLTYLISIPLDLIIFLPTIRKNSNSEIDNCLYFLHDSLCLTELIIKEHTSFYTF